MKDSTRRFLELMEKQNARVAAEEAKKQEAAALIEPDHIRLQREQERRDELGQLRAREHSSRRPHRVRNLFGYTDLSGD